MNHPLSRRKFLASFLLLLAAAACGVEPPAETPEPIIDIHQHTNYSFRTDEQLLAHQKAMGVTKTILLPAGALYGLEANATGNQAADDFVLNQSCVNMFIPPTKSPACRARAQNLEKMAS